MLSRVLIIEFKWIIIALIISFVLVNTVNSSIPIDANQDVQKTFLGLNLFLEILVFFIFNTFVVFGIKGFFERYSQKFANIIIFSTGIMLEVIIFILAYQILF
jgi:hypothetical protein